MNIQGLVRLDKSYTQRLINLMSESFMQDPLYVGLIPDENVRARLLPLYFESYFKYLFDYFSVYADSEALNGAVVVWDDTCEYSSLRYCADGIRSGLFTALSVIRADDTLKTAWRFLRGLRYLKSTWVKRVVHAPTVHIDYLAVRESSRGQGISTKLMENVLAYARQRSLPATLETHNSRNVAIYRHFGFRTVLELTGRGLHQYCMVE